MDARLIPLCAAAAVPPGSATRAEHDGRSYAVFNLAGAYYVTQDQCTHGPGLLADGFVEGEEVECPFHAGRFHIPSGQPVAPPCTEAVRVWRTALVDGAVCIDPAEGA